jgi:isopenicillin-N N-acyltransferase-like protein
MALIQDRMPALTVGEDPHERGLAHGRAFKAEVAANLEVYLRRFEASGLARADAYAEAQRWGAAMRRQNAEYAAEMAGLARGADQEAAAIFLLNARYEITYTLFGKDARDRDKAVAETDGCTAFGALPEATADGSTWLGQNWDWLAGVHRNTLVLRIRRKSKPSLVCVTEAGIVGGKMGVNSAGIGLVENGLASSRDGRHPHQKPFHMRCREILDADRFEDALRPVIETRRTCSANFVVGDAGGEIIDIETSPDHLTCLWPVDGIVTHSNHFIGSGHGESLMERNGPNTLYRAERLRRLLMQDHGKLGLDRFKAAMADRFGAPSAISRSSDERVAEARQNMTNASVLIDLGRRVMHVAAGPPHAYAYHPFAIDGEET